jgi:hypothetical protein
VKALPKPKNEKTASTSASPTGQLCTYVELTFDASARWTVTQSRFSSDAGVTYPLEFVFAQFYPGLANREDLSRFVQSYPELEYQEILSQQITPFVTYTRSLREQSDLKTLPLDEYIPFLIRLMVRAGLVDMSWRDAEKQDSFKASLQTYLV